MNPDKFIQFFLIKFSPCLCFSCLVKPDTKWGKRDRAMVPLLRHTLLPPGVTALHLFYVSLWREWFRSTQEWPLGSGPWWENSAAPSLRISDLWLLHCSLRPAGALGNGQGPAHTTSQRQPEVPTFSARCTQFFFFFHCSQHGCSAILTLFK